METKKEFYIRVCYTNKFGAQKKLKTKRLEESAAKVVATYIEKTLLRMRCLATVRLTQEPTLF